METQAFKFPITGNEGSPIELDVAAKWTENHRNRHPDEVISHFFGNVLLDQILKQEGCMGLRIYYADEHELNGWQKFWISVSNFLLKVIGNVENKRHFILAGVNKFGDDLLPGENTAPGDGTTVRSYSAKADSVIGEQSMPCPGSSGCPKNKLSAKVVTK